jgi:hypothetical protein
MPDGTIEIPFAKEITSIQAYGRCCVGCQEHQKDVMLSFQFEEHGGVNDIFLTTKQAEYLAEKLLVALRGNIAFPQRKRMLDIPQHDVDGD